jgi:hypothetical protein
MLCYVHGFSPHASTFHAFQQTKIKPVNLVNPVRKNKFIIYEVFQQAYLEAGYMADKSRLTRSHIPLKSMVLSLGLFNESLL